ncbi:hypothetical protein VPH35_094184 [Triticum aestivum]
MREVPIQSEFLPINSWLVVCGDMLLMIAQRLNSGGLDGSSFKVFRLDFTVEPAKWVKVEKLENIELFVSLDRRDPTFSCMSPERWGGKSNYVYFARLCEDPDETWTSAELGQLVPENAIHPMFYGMSFPPDYGLLSNLWVFPNLIYGSG